MFKIFSFGFSNIVNLGNIEKINRVMNSFLDNIYINELTENYKDTFYNTSYKETVDVNEGDFIDLKQYEDMYLLTIDLKGIDLREVSIRYDPGIIEINLNRSEIEKGSFWGTYSNMFVKKAYNKKFENIERIDTSQILKSIDNGILSMRMQKKYALESVSNVIEVDSYEDN
ncbi:molecular chaperone [Clostridium beijerinckii]|nr:molecular chaperone [Clostridium beijerinckii]